MRVRSPLSSRVLVWVICSLSVVACTSTKGVTPQPVPEPVPAPAPDPVTIQDPMLLQRVAELEAELEAERETVLQLRQQQEQLRIQLEQKEVTIASVEERFAVLQTELTSAVDQVVQSEGSVRGLQSRALATSRISEVRVQLQAVTAPEDTEVAARLSRARDFLNRADAALTEGSYGAASYLAERASELVRQARIVSEIRASRSAQQRQIIPVVPPRELVLTTNANLRAGPGVDQQRIGGLKQGEQVVAVARAGEWYRVEIDSGGLVWIHGRLLN